MTAVRAGAAAQRLSVLEFAPLPTAVSCGRLHAAAVLTEWRVSRELIADVQIVVSELTTNAVDASAALAERPPVRLVLAMTSSSVVVEVWDQSPLDPELHEPGENDECGRGLTLVAALSTRWGFERTGYRRKVVWAECAWPGGG